MDDRWNTLYDLAHEQRGHFTSRQAEQLGYARSTLHHHQQRGRIERVLWGVYRLRNYPPTEREREAALTLWSADRDGIPQAVVSHETALAYYELSDAFPRKIHLSVPRDFRKRPPDDVVLHKVDLNPEDMRREGLLRITTPLRTLQDLALERFPTQLLVQALEEARDRGLIRQRDLSNSIGGEGPHTDALHEVLAWAQPSASP